MPIQIERTSVNSWLIFLANLLLLLLSLAFASSASSSDASSPYSSFKILACIQMCKLHFARSRIVQSAPSNAASIDLNRPQVAPPAPAPASTQTETWFKLKLQVTRIYLIHLIYLFLFFFLFSIRDLHFQPALNSQFPIFNPRSRIAFNCAFSRANFQEISSLKLSIRCLEAKFKQMLSFPDQTQTCNLHLKLSRLLWRKSLAFFQ